MSWRYYQRKYKQTWSIKYDQKFKRGKVYEEILIPTLKF